MSHRLIIMGAALGLALLADPALADAIDGDWCHRDGRRFSIRGPEIVTPGGARMAGNYSRHAFNYAVPPPEPGAGATIFMTLIDENTVRLRQGEAIGAETEEWRRCSNTTSALGRLPPT